MSDSIKIPNPRDLLPPLLACLPTAAVSVKPPPALLELLSPILRQRLHIFSSSPSADSWLRLLNWNRDEASKLEGVVEQMNIEAHPVSGELELGDVEDIGYRRLDSETIHAHIEIEQYSLLTVYLWCTASMNTNGKPGWRLAELKALEDKDESILWYSSLNQAESEFKSQQSARSQMNSSSRNGLPTPGLNDMDDDDDGSYWAAYDRTPGQTPSKQSPAPGYQANASAARSTPRTELDYYERYNQVQPVMDPYDAEEDMEDTQDSSLNHHRGEYFPTDSIHMVEKEEHERDPVELVISVPDTPHHPRPSSASSPRSVQSLEEKAESQSQAEVAIKQHISTDIKSLYRLARSSGITRSEFERIIKTELEVLPLMDME